MDLKNRIYKPKSYHCLINLIKKKVRKHTKLETLVGDNY